MQVEPIRGVRRTFGVLAVAVSAIAGLSAPPTAGADVAGPLNGTYTATSIGDQAKTNSRYQAEATVRSTWTIRTTCSFADVCAGTVTSDQGWTADVYNLAGLWYVKRDLPDWAPCPDGVTTSPGQQVFRFYPVGFDGMVVRESSTWAGWDETNGLSGACGRNLQQQIAMPFRLDRIA